MEVEEHFVADKVFGTILTPKTGSAVLLVCSFMTMGMLQVDLSGLVTTRA